MYIGFFSQQPGRQNALGSESSARAPAPPPQDRAEGGHGHTISERTGRDPGRD